MDEDDARSPSSATRRARSRASRTSSRSRRSAFAARRSRASRRSRGSRSSTRARGARRRDRGLVEGGGAAARGRPARAEGTTRRGARSVLQRPRAPQVPEVDRRPRAAHVERGGARCAALARPDVTFMLVARRARRRASGCARRRGASARRRRIDGERARARAAARAGRCASRRTSRRPSARARARSALHLFVNGRPVRDRQLARAVAQAYGSVLEPGRYPVGVVYLDLPPRRSST